MSFAVHRQDQDTAKIVAFNVQKLARKGGKAVIAATTHTDLLGYLKPSVHKRFGREIEVKYHPNEINNSCSLIRRCTSQKGPSRIIINSRAFIIEKAKGWPQCARFSF